MAAGTSIERQRVFGPRMTPRSGPVILGYDVEAVTNAVRKAYTEGRDTILDCLLPLEIRLQLLAERTPGTPASAYQRRRAATQR